MRPTTNDERLITHDPSSFTAWELAGIHIFSRGGAPHNAMQRHAPDRIRDGCRLETERVLEAPKARIDGKPAVVAIPCIAGTEIDPVDAVANRVHSEGL